MSINPAKGASTKLGVKKTPMQVIKEEQDETEERKTMDKLENIQQSISIDGECKLTLNYHDPDTNVSGHVAGLSQELSSSRIDPKTFQFDKVFGPQDNQQDVFNEVKDVVRSVIDGQKVCIFAYGQTGAGKTYTMSGSTEETGQGIIPRAVQLIFDTLDKYKKDGVLTQDTKVSMSCIELHCDLLQDLLDINNKCTQMMTNG